MSEDADGAVKEAAMALSGSKSKAAEVALLRALSNRMVREASSFDPVHGLVRVVPATDECGEVRVTSEGGWKLGSAPEQDLLEVWEASAHPSLARILDGVQETFSSAKVSALIGEIKQTLA